jgi:superfamily I DNA and RNA helicase
MSSFFFLQADENQANHEFIQNVENFAEQNKIQAYVINKPLGENKYTYSYSPNALILLVPKHQIIFVDFAHEEASFDAYVEEVIEDLGSISDKYRYKDFIGRPKSWANDLVTKIPNSEANSNIGTLLSRCMITSAEKQRKCELLISLLTGSINDIEKVKASIPESLLDKVKQKILLFDGDQTRFVYQESKKSPIRIQGLSGTGKTELLLHKLKELYVASSDDKVVFTCHNKILADNLKRRIPDFFNFMKVEQQIKWDERLWCMHAWGSESNKNSGTYSYICDFYKLSFNRYSYQMSFERACERALADIRAIDDNDKLFAFDFMLIDESQDFPDSFFELCTEVTRSTVYIAGDTFQSIFAETITASIDPDFLLSKCYRTDPRTLMFAHALGMGLFENEKLRWLEDAEWKACGYLVEKEQNGALYKLSREPLRRFEDIDRDIFKSVEIIKTTGDFYKNAVDCIVTAIETIKKQNPTAGADDIGIILLDTNKSVYELADALEVAIPRTTGWLVNKAYESKRKLKDTLFISNRNNVKGLEFPFVICVTSQIRRSYAYRNALYMTLTRSFLQTHLVVSSESNSAILASIEAGLGQINASGVMEVRAPSAIQQATIKTKINIKDSAQSFFDFLSDIFDELGVLPIYRLQLTDAVKSVVGEKFDYDNVKEIVEFNYRKMTGE